MCWCRSRSSSWRPSKVARCAVAQRPARGRTRRPARASWQAPSRPTRGRAPARRAGRRRTGRLRARAGTAGPPRPQGAPRARARSFVNVSRSSTTEGRSVAWARTTLASSPSSRGRSSRRRSWCSATMWSHNSRSGTLVQSRSGVGALRCDLERRNGLVAREGRVPRRHRPAASSRRSSSRARALRRRGRGRAAPAPGRRRCGTGRSAWSFLSLVAWPRG